MALLSHILNTLKDIEMAVIFLGAVGALAWLSTGLVLRHALRHGLLDVPNERSSHTVPTPRGGGLGIAVSFLVAVALLVFWGLPAHVAAALMGGGMVAGVGWLDDRRPTSPLLRLSVHALAALWAVVWLHGLPSLDLGIIRVPLGMSGSVLAVIALVWITNLYNFMDGIDGLAASQALLAGIGGGWLLWQSGDASLAMVSFSLAAASGGFLIWNWPPARIFMGDTGSGLLGFSLGTIALAGEQRGSLPALVWMILLALFIGDATLTLLRRLFQGEAWYNAHRSHAYQRLVQRGWSHLRVTLGAWLINGAFLWPMAWWAWHRREWLPAAWLATWVSVGVLWKKIR